MKTAITKAGLTNLSVSAVITAAVAAAGKIPIILWIFLAAVAIDYATGWIKAKYFVRDWNSKAGLQGAIKKIMYFVMIGTAFLIGFGIREIGAKIGVNLEYAMLIGWYVTAVMLVNEFTSILENLYVIMPNKVPTWLIKTLKVADGTLDKKINGIVCKNQNCEKCELKARCNTYQEGKDKDEN